MLKKVVIIFALAYWPINLYLANSHQNFLEYAIPTVLLATAFFLYKKYPKYYLIPILLIGIFEKKLVLLPVIFCSLDFLLTRTRLTIIIFALSLVVFLLSFKSFAGQTVFVRDYEGEQLVIRNIHLYPNVFMARLFQNKPRIYLNKITGNFFVLTDPNNYFFALHPRPILIDNQNLNKYPFFAIVFFIVGIFTLDKSKYKNFVIISSLSAITALSILTNFDRNDFILWVPVSLIIIHGVEKIF